MTSGDCKHFQIRLEDFVYGEIEAKDAAELRAHLAACPQCRSEHELLQRENEAYSSFFQETALEPSEEMWNAIRSRIEAGPSRVMANSDQGSGFFASLFRPGFARQMFAAAALVVLTVMATLYFVSRDSGEVKEPPVALNSTPVPVATATPATAVPSSAPVPPSPGAPPHVERRVSTKGLVRMPAPALSEDEQVRMQIARTEQEYIKAIRLLDRAIAKRKEALDLAVTSQYEASLALIDDSISKSRAALRKQPGDLAAGQFLLAAYARKVELMQEIAVQ
jgi:Putative zinc-finger